jgi:peptidoglycan/xylan/chitin deacetylase (PgdA/CDA1 family)
MHAESSRLSIVMYHYVRNLPHTRFPRLKGLLVEDFHRQLALLQQQYEMATLESALAFLEGTYRPHRDLCLLTFDDAVKEHYTEVLPALMRSGVQGVFFVASSSPDGTMLSVHKSHFLMATLTFDEYRSAFLAELAAAGSAPIHVDEAAAQRGYRWDPPEVAAFKFLMNFGLTSGVRDAVLDGLFARYLGDEASFARELYVSWDELREMQACGMVAGGHAHTHAALGTCDEELQRHELEQCATTIRTRLRPQDRWPFAYPYGSFTPVTARLTREHGFDCAFTTEAGANDVADDLFRLRRLDTNDLAM